MLTKPEIYSVANGYIGVSSGYLGDFSYRSLEEFYPYYCDLNISSTELEGTIRQRFLQILETADEASQARILRGVLMKYPIEYFPEDQQENKRQAALLIGGLIDRLEGNAVQQELLIFTNDTVDRAIKDTKLLIEKNGATSGVDRIHTALHGYVKEVCKRSGIQTDEEDSLTQIFKKLKNSHPALQNNGPRQSDIDHIINSFANTLDKLNPIRNKASLSHPNDDLLEEDEAMFVINSA